uniref:Ankyrin repeat protein n=1 Tax=Panagrolaimus superbus TaxID=310955 RepID=A0A914YKU5_9BILA
MTALHVAAKYSTEEIVRMLMDKNLDLNKPAGADGKLPIHYACQRHSNRGLGIIQTFLKSNSELRLAEDKKKNLPLHYAIKAGNISITQFLLTFDAIDQIHCPNVDGNKPLHLAAQKNFDMLRTIAAAGGHLDANERNNIGRTALHEVAEKGDEQMLKLMFRMKADANIMDKVMAIAKY